MPLVLWASFVLTFAALSYSVRFSEGKPDRDVLYKWSTVAAGLAQFVVVALIGSGIGIAMLVLVSLLGPLLDPGQEQGLTPDHWESAHAAAYVGNGLVVAVVAPVVEELTFRGLGYSLLARFGRWTAIVLVGVLFALAHGLVEAFPFLAAFGAMLAYLRSRVDSIYPGMIAHAVFNATALVIAVAG